MWKEETENETEKSVNPDYSKIKDRHHTTATGISENTKQNKLKISIPKNIMVKLQKTKDKGKILKENRKYKGKKNSLPVEKQGKIITMECLPENMQAGIQWN